eukprot:CAMPEP_0184966676 /NCGR_PEP_ID=MMETSP1098-20130426/290_1 /TAXON_ID=89044 /ORGANISM="Spumella elongata, Strain CCAP 955/1" /LENGTH=180 /DNA_ID=CAMNT_0027487997 /DNA_START=91 /DNA_END=633 /DNA_ORIENTATION=+
MAISGPDDLSPRQSPRALQVNDVFPRIELTDENGRPITLHAENGRPRLIVFYRGAFCNYCEESLTEINKRVNTFYSAGIDVICVSADGVAESKQLSERLELRFPIACGLTIEQMEKIGLYIHTRDPTTSPKYAYCNQRRRNQPDLNLSSWRKPFCEPAHFLIRRDNTIKSATQPEALYHL